MKILLPFAGVLAIAISGCSGSASNSLSPTIPTAAHQSPASVRVDSVRVDSVRTDSVRTAKPASVRIDSVRLENPASVRAFGARN